MKNDNDRFYIDPDGILLVSDEPNTSESNNVDDSEQKQTAVLPGLATPSKLDKEVEEILQSIKPEVMESIKKTKYFSKNNKIESNQS